MTKGKIFLYNVLYLIFTIPMAFSKSSLPFAHITPKPCRPIFTMLMTLSTGFAQELLGAVLSAMRASRSRSRKRDTMDNFTDMYVTRWSGPPSV